ncbi:Putative membrane protein [Zobellia galactanivorans]|uniref:Putative membrane protein n=1 Tax=Zobellia galactanivorans (strain DSM 12802 / CCUG 47099 / CIP 106680 / NCIMB 13871 / Dsij) TaxID=63186 RepID=G0LCA8_ZOBGA|nr:Putative membrane protein [Zobellia galactanivorans]
MCFFIYFSNWLTNLVNQIYVYLFNYQILWPKRQVKSQGLVNGAGFATWVSGLFFALACHGDSRYTDAMEAPFHTSVCQETTKDMT